MHALLLALVKDDHGQVMHKVSRDVQSEVSDQTWAAVRLDSMTWDHPITLLPGRYTVETVVVDEEGGRASAAVEQINSVEVRGISLSDPALVRSLQELTRSPNITDPFEFTGKRVLPFVSARVKAGAKPAVYFVVYPRAGQSARPRVLLDLLQAGRVISSREITPPEADASGAMHVLVSGGEAPGDYELRITALQSAASSVRSIKYTIEGDQ